MALPTKPDNLPTDMENPVRGEPRATFAAKANTFLQRLVDEYTPDLNALADWFNQMGGEIVTLGDNAEQSATNAANAQSAAEGFRDEAEGFKDSAEAAAIAAQAGAGLPTMTQNGDVLTITDAGTNAVAFVTPSVGTNNLTTYINTSASGSIDLDLSIYSAFEITAVGDLTLNAVNLPETKRSTALLSAVGFSEHNVSAGSNISLDNADFNTVEGYSAIYDVSTDISANIASVKAIRTTANGDRAFILDRTSQEIQAWTANVDGTLTKATAVFTTALDTDVVSFDFNEDGTKLYVLGFQNKRLYQFSMSTAYDIENATYDSINPLVNDQGANPFAVRVENDAKVYILDSGEIVYQYSITSGNVSTISYDSISLSFSTQDASGSDLAFNSAKTEMYLTANINDSILVAKMPTANTLSGASIDTSKTMNISQHSTLPAAIDLNATLGFFYVGDSSIDDVLAYKLSVPDSIHVDISVVILAQFNNFITARNL